ncbi:hypothetical protein RHGRI_016752 [Rhododendron griersonianum]|uniref:Uncharacterized protein n=1 Tax=Rhododendron griersonianum TaxID=479676 RepID=A0AAV6JVA0_9ERIC|nr:hypothetical protein RHGRI_016752 [Rhododendron griersonianum]
MAPQSPITRYLHCPTPSRAGPNSPVWNYIPRMKRLPGTGDTQFLLLREGVESPPDWFIKGGVPQNLVEEYNHMASSGQASFTKELIQAWDSLPLRHLQFHRLPNDLPTHTHQLRKDIELILPSGVHHAEVISARGFGQLRITAEQLIMYDQPSYRLSVATFDALDQSQGQGLGPAFLPTAEEEDPIFDNAATRPPTRRPITILWWNCKGATRMSFYKYFLDTVTLH